MTDQMITGILYGLVSCENIDTWVCIPSLGAPRVLVSWGAGGRGGGGIADSRGVVLNPSGSLRSMKSSYTPKNYAVENTREQSGVPQLSPLRVGVHKGNYDDAGTRGAVTATAAPLDQDVETLTLYVNERSNRSVATPVVRQPSNYFTVECAP